MKYIFSIPYILLLLSVIQDSQAKVSPEQAHQLSSTLTAMGAEKKGNATGSIPSYNGGLTKSTSSNLATNIFSNERPLFTITSKNLSKYKSTLSNGQIALFEKFPDSYTMPVYKTHRSAAYPKAVYQKALINVVNAELVDGGNGLKNFDETVPFAIPQNGLEVIWNHISRFRGGSVERNSATLPVQVDGSFVPVKVRSQMTNPHYLSNGFNAQHDSNMMYYFTQSIKSPARLSGNVLLVHETIDQLNQPRMAWNYNAGQRRVRRAPQVGYDAPVASSDDLRTSDQTDMFNGSPDKYHWKLIGKKEMYIPYNANQLINPDLKYTDIISAGHLNQVHSRYELHRVWQVEASLKENKRHIYGKRTYYLDEDSWQIALADHYDNRGQLWRVAEGHGMQFREADTFWYAANTSYDLFSGRYVVNLSNEEKQPFKFGQKLKRKHFTTSALRRQGKF